MSPSRAVRLILGPVLVLLVSIPVVLLLLALETGPGVPLTDSLGGAEVARIEQLLLESAPQSPADPGVQELRLNADELNLLLRYGIEMSKRSQELSARVTLRQDGLDSALSYRLFQGWMPLFLNVTAGFRVADQTLYLDSLRIGKFTFPDSLLQFATDRVRENLRDASPVVQDGLELLSKIERISVDNSALQVALQWDPALIGRISDEARQLFVSEQDQLRIINHYGVIAEVATTIPTDIRAVSLNTFLVPLFDQARSRSREGSDPIAENRTLFQALAIYVNNEDIAQLLGAELAREIAPAKYIEVRLQRRQDLAQHLVSIAAITASAGAEFAQLLSTTKEAYDARYRSGFSFSDLTANTVGVSLASLATRDNETALLVQERLAALQNESDYMPTVGNNRDGLSESAFNALYSDRSSDQYQQRLAEIEQLIAARPVFRGML